ncbi:MULTISPECIES: fibrinogen-binding adhesin SdrG C-terminal domain-containing protein, partial [unclassified Staphylococcus]
MNKKYDFVTNKLNKYTIRKFSIGTASILLGATLIFGMSQEAKADEDNSAQSEDVDLESSEKGSKNSTVKLQGEDLNEQPSDLTTQNPENSTNKGFTSASEANQLDEVGNTNSEEIENSNNQTTNQDKLVEKQVGAKEVSDNKELSFKSDNEIPNKEVEKNKVEKQNENHPSGDVLDQENEVKVEENISSKEAATPNYKEENNKNELVESVEDTVVPNSETSSATNNVNNEEYETKKSSAEVAYYSNDTIKPNSNSLRANTSDDASETKGSTVNDKIKIDSFNFNNKPINPNNSGYTNMNVNFSIEGNVREGDYFTFILPHNLTGDGDIDYSNVGNVMQLPDIKNSKGEVVAKGNYDTINKQGTYTFTDYVNNKKNIAGKFDIPLFTDRKNTPYSGNYPVEFNIADKTFDSSIDINYGSPVYGQPGSYGANITSFITEIDNAEGNNRYKQTVYVNPKGNDIYNSVVTLKGYHDDPSESSTVLNLKDSNIRVYEVKDNTKITDSYYIDPQNPNYTDITDDVTPYIKDNGNNTVSIDFGNINKTYVITVDGKYNNSGKNVKTRVIETNTDRFGIRDSAYYWDNENIVTNGSGDADGDDDDTDADSDA